jgi:glycosyltransferase involved in cell wall biosynthesis
MEKLKVLAINVDNDGVGYHRVLSPHTILDEENIDVDIRNLGDHTLPLLDENFLKNYNIIFYNKKIPFSDEIKKITFKNILNKYNIKLVFDIDDHWELNSSHVNYKSWIQNNGKESVLTELRGADYVTTTTPIFAEDIKEINPNVKVIPNAVNLKEYQWLDKKVPSDKIRFLWGGGITHLPDLRLLQPSFKKFDKEFLEKCQLYLCGFDLRMRTKEGMAKSDWRSNQWTFFEDIFTNDLKYIKNTEYFQWLRKYEDGGKDNYGARPEYINEFYQRRWTKPILLYGTQYNETDVALAPIKSGVKFNMVKSQLKIIEAGAHKCPIIASNFGSYTLDDIEGKIDSKPKGFLIDENDKDGWYQKMKWFSQNPEAVREYGDNLYEYIKSNYDLRVVNKERAEFYRSIVR